MHTSPPALSTVEGPALIHAEGPTLSTVEGHMCAAVGSGAPFDLRNEILGIEVSAHARAWRALLHTGSAVLVRFEAVPASLQAGLCMQVEVGFRPRRGRIANLI
jgi:hypothetical protein